MKMTLREQWLDKCYAEDRRVILAYEAGLVKYWEADADSSLMPELSKLRSEVNKLQSYPLLTADRLARKLCDYWTALCNHCGETRHQHAGGTKCLFEPTSFTGAVHEGLHEAADLEPEGAAPRPPDLSALRH